MASNSRQVLLRLKGESADGRRAINEIRSDLRKMSREEFSTRLDIQTARAERALAKINEQLANYRKQSPSAEVDLKIAKAEEKAALISLRLDRLSLKKVNIDVDIRRGGIERTAAALGSVERGVTGVTRGVGDAARAVPILGQVFGTVLNGAVSLVSTLASGLGSLVTAGLETVANTFKSLSGLGALAGPIGAVVASLVGMVAQFVLLAAVGGAVVIVLNAVLGAIIALSGALVALVASLAAALGGLAAMAVAFGGVLIPIVVVAIGLFTRFAAIIKARQAREQELTQAVQAQKTAEQQRKDALEASRAAHERLAEATVAGNRAMAQSAVDLRDAELGLASSRLGVKEARLNLLEAKRALSELRKESSLGAKSLDPLFKRATDIATNPAQQRAAIGDIKAQGGKADPLELQKRILAVQRAQLGVKESINQTAHAEDALAEATRKRADFVKRGIEAYKPYRTALEAVRRSEQRLQRAQDQTSAASRKYEAALKKLSGTERGTLDRVNKLVKGFTALAKAFTDPIFRAANDVFDALSGKAGLLKDGLTKVGTAMGDALRQFGRFLAEPRTIAAFGIMADGAADLVRTIGGRAFTAFLRIMREVAVSALPAVRHAARDVADALEGVAGKPGKIHRTVNTLIAQFKTWARLAGSLIGLVKDLFGPASKDGASLADSMRHVVDRWREWIRANPEKVREFFRQAIERTKEIVRQIARIVTWLRDTLPPAAKAAADAFRGIYNWAKKVYDIVKKVIDLAKGKFKIFGHKIDIPGPGDLLNPKNLIPDPTALPRKAIKGADKLKDALGDALKKKSKKPEDFRSPDAGRGRFQAQGASVTNIFNIPRPLDATKPIDPPHTAKLLQLAWEAQGGGFS